jgi:hypothetical protein
VAPFWKQRPFADQVAEVDAWLDAAEIAAGKSYGAWLLLAAAAQRAERGSGVPPLALWNAPLGQARHLNGALVGYRAPRAAQVRTALGIDLRHRGAILPTARLSFVFDDDNRQASDADAASLRRVGFDVHAVARREGETAVAAGQRLRSVVESFAADLLTARRLGAAARERREIQVASPKLQDGCGPLSQAS